MDEFGNAQAAMKMDGFSAINWRKAILKWPLRSMMN